MVLLRGWKVWVSSTLLFSAMGHATDQFVDDPLDLNSPGTLRYALTNIGAEGGNISFDPSITSIFLFSPLPGLTSTGPVAINSTTGPVVTLDGLGAFPLFYVNQGSVEMSNFVLQSGRSLGGAGGGGSPTGMSESALFKFGGGGGGGGLGAGGALFVDQEAEVTLTNVSFSDNSAVGGQGGTGSLVIFSESFPLAIGSGAGGGGGGALYGSQSLGGWALGAIGTGSPQDLLGGGGGGGNTPGSSGALSALQIGGQGGGPSGGMGGTAQTLPGAMAYLPWSGGGGGGGGLFDPGVTGGAGGAGSSFGGGGGAGGNGTATLPLPPGGAGGFGGGGGGGGQNSVIPDFLAAPLLATGGWGGFGAGGGGGGGLGGYAGATGLTGGGGGGGAGLGGAVFVRQGGVLNLHYTSDWAGSTAFTGNQVTAGTGASLDPALIGQAYGEDLFLNSGSQLVFQTDFPVTISSAISSDPLYQGTTKLTIQGSEYLTLLGNNTFDGTISVTGGKLAINSIESLGVNNSGQAALILDQGTVRSVSSSEILFSSELPIYIGDRGAEFAVPQGQTMAFGAPLVPLGGSEGIGGVRISGSGTTLFQSLNTYGGTTWIGPSATLGIDLASATLSTPFVLEEGTLSLLGGLNLNSIVSGTGVLQAGTAAQVALGGTNTYSGLTQIVSGATLSFTNTAAISPLSLLDIEGMAVFSYPAGTASPYSITGSGSIKMNSPGTLILSNDNTFEGYYLLDAGAVQISGASGLGSGFLIFEGGALECVADVSLSNTLILQPPGGTLLMNNGATLNLSGSISSGGALNCAGTGQIQLNGSSSYSGNTTIAEPTVLTLLNDSALPQNINIINQGLLQCAFSGDLGNSISGSGAVSVLQGNLQFSQDNSYGGTTTLYPDTTLTIATPASFPPSGALVNAGLFTVALPSSAPLSMSGSIQGSGAIQVDTGTLILSGINSYGGTTTIGAQGKLLIPEVLALPSGSTVINEGVLRFQNRSATAMPAVIEGMGRVEMDGTGGRLLLSPANFYEGGTYFNSGTVCIGAAAALGSSGLSFNGGSLLLTSPFTGPLAATSALNSQEASIQVTQGVNALYSGWVTGEGSLAVLGEGALMLSAINDYSGNTTVGSSATLELLISGALPGSSPVSNAGDLVFNISGATVAIPNFIQGEGRVSLTGSSVFSLEDSSNSYEGGTWLTTGTLQVSDFSSIGSGPLTLAEGGVCEILPGFLQSLGQQIILAPGSGALKIDEGAVLSFSGQVTSSSDEAFAIEGSGMIRFLGSNQSLGDTTVTEATVSLLGGSFAGALNLQGDATLQGYGSVGALTNQGLVYPNDTTALSVTGDYTQESTGSFKAKIHGGGRSSVLTVGGAASLDGTLEVIAPAGGYAFGTEYRIISAQDPLVTTFSSLSLPASPQLLVTYSEDPHVILTVTSQSILEGTHVHEHNPQQVQKNLQEILHTPGSDFIHVIEAMEDFDSDQLTAALNQLHPAPFGAFELMHLNASSQVTALFAQHGAEECCAHLSEPCASTNNSVWIAPFGYFYDQTPVGEQLGFDATSVGVLAGINHCFANGILLGIGGGYHIVGFDWDHHRGHGTMDTAFGALYVDYAQGGLVTALSVVGGIDQFYATREIDFSSIDRQAKHSQSGYDVAAHWGLGHDARLGGVTIHPFLDLDYLCLYQKGFTEYGAGDLNLSVAGRHAHLLRSEVGLSVTRSFRVGTKGCFAPTLWLSGINECYLRKRHYRAHFTGENPNFNVRTWNKPLYLISPGVDLSVLFGSGISAAFGYSAELSSSVTTQKLEGRVEWFF